jgi:hypothetical protein
VYSKRQLQYLLIVFTLFLDEPDTLILSVLMELMRYDTWLTGDSRERDFPILKKVARGFTIPLPEGTLN